MAVSSTILRQVPLALITADSAACSVQTLDLAGTDQTAETTLALESTGEDASVPTRPSADDEQVVGTGAQQVASLDPSCQTSSCCTLSTVLTGTSGANTINGSASAECIVGLGGNDTLTALGQNDELFGGDGVDTVYGGTGNDLISGGTGADVLRGDAGIDKLYGGREADDIAGGDGDDTIYPGMGADHVSGDNNNDTVVLRDVCEIVSGETLAGGAGTDTLVTPVPLAELVQMGVTVSGFETVLLDQTWACEAECRLPCKDVDPRYIGWTDPTIWQVDAGSGKRFRRTTAAERSSNHWLLGTYLVEDSTFVDNAALGSASLTLHLPVSATAVQAVAMSKSGSTNYHTKIQRTISSSSLSTAVTKPTINTYLPTGFNTQSPHPVNGAWVGALTLSDGEILVQGAFKGQRVRVDGRNPGWTISTVPLPAGQPTITASKLVAVNFLALGDYGQAAFNDCEGAQSAWSCGWICDVSSAPCGDNSHGQHFHDCNDGMDNDGDLTTDLSDVECKHHTDYSCGVHPAHAHFHESGESFGIFADGRYCTAFKSNWFAELTNRGWESEGLLNEAAPGGTGGEARYLVGGCWIFPSVTDAHACTFDGSCSTYAGDYPYQGAGDDVAGFYSQVWRDVAHGADHGLDEPLNQAVALYFGYDGTLTNNEFDIVKMACGGTEGTGCCGAMSWATCDFVGASAAEYQSPPPENCSVNGVHDTIAHEMGHNMGLIHEEGALPNSFMHAGQHGQSDLSVGNETQIIEGMETAECGRRPGFEWMDINPDPVPLCGACP